MFIFLSINSLSTEALKSGLLRSGLAAIWTWTILARSLHYQSSHCQACCPGWADKHRRKRQLLSRGTVFRFTETVLFMCLLHFHKASPVPKGLGHRQCGRCCGIGIHVWWQPERLWQRDKDILIPVGLSSRSRIEAFTGCAQPADEQIISVSWTSYEVWNLYKTARYLVPDPTCPGSSQ